MKAVNKPKIDLNKREKLKYIILLDIHFYLLNYKINIGSNINLMSEYI